MGVKMFSTITSRSVASALTLALGASLTVVPAANAVEAPAELPMACNLKIVGKDVDEKAGIYDFANNADTYAYRSQAFKDEAFKLSIPVSAPEGVKSGEKFDYVLKSTSLKFPARLSSPIRLKNTSQINLWIDLPETASVQEVITGNANPAVKVELTSDYRRLHITAAQDAADVTTWGDSNDDGEWVAGGLAASPKDNNFHEVVLPEITLKMTATGGAGEKIQPTVRDTNPEDFSPESFFQLYSDVVWPGFFSNSEGPSLARCSLSTASVAQTKPFLSIPITEGVAVSRHTISTKVRVTDHAGNPLEAGTPITLNVNGKEQPFEVGADGYISFSAELIPEETREYTVFFPDNDQHAVTFTLQGGTANSESIHSELLKKKEPQRYEVPVKVRVASPAGEALPVGSELSIDVDGKVSKFAVIEGSFITFPVQVIEGQAKELKVAFADSPESAITVTVAGKEHIKPFIADDALVQAPVSSPSPSAAPEPPQTSTPAPSPEPTVTPSPSPEPPAEVPDPTPKPTPPGTSSGSQSQVDMADPKVWASILGVSITVPLLLALIKWDLDILGIKLPEIILHLPLPGPLKLQIF
ncbi:hypothetical protein CPHO_00335 [Corynebacterium phocae]|uniref:Bacterial Ig-like domain-containing protein n=1 Tax=Corynebacterium phocae TaxID=161895 RepID=A0A1L7D0P2_9CORY|nr:hypothetical protein [Corynebacterium phocae]APT91633.1 hypothetical protein CPHO_00335 [Corynebacterium phocae]KAA8720711.1 hypothetical protein F4V58_12210 [Corynebacterium phocae]